MKFNHDPRRPEDSLEDLIAEARGVADLAIPPDQAEADAIREVGQRAMEMAYALRTVRASSGWKALSEPTRKMVRDALGESDITLPLADPADPE